jgi:tetratricopeptide (TPR) repeat protein
MPTDGFKYYAFISYSHQDKKWGDWLHKALETYRVPKRLVGQASRGGETVPGRIMPVFRDREELPTATNLGEAINEALIQSRYLVVVCSPRSAKSRWVNEEILSYKRMGRSDRILAVIVDGEPNALDKPEFRDDLECFPEALKFELDEDGQLSDRRSEPIAADAREGKDGKGDASLKLIAGILGVGFDDLKRRELQRRQRRLVAISTTALVLMVFMAGLTAWAFVERDRAAANEQKAVASKTEADTQRTEAEMQRDVAQDRFDDVRALANTVLFELHDSIEYLPGATKARQLLIKTGFQYLEALSKEGIDNPELMFEVGSGYVKLGDVSGGHGIANLGDRKAAIAYYQKGLGILQSLVDASPKQFRAMEKQREAYSRLGWTYLASRVDENRATGRHERAAAIQKKIEMAVASHRKGLAIAQKLASLDPDGPHRAHLVSMSHRSLGYALSHQKKEDEAIQHLEKGLETVRREVARDPKDVGLQVDLCGALSNLGSIYGDFGKHEKNLAQQEEALKIIEAVRRIHPNHAMVLRQHHSIIHNLGSAYSDLGRTDEALTQLRKSLAIRQRSSDADPQNVKAHEELMEMHDVLAKLTYRMKRPDESVKHRRAILSYLQRRHNASPNDYQVALELIDAYKDLGWLQYEAGDARSAHQLYQDGLAVCGRVLKTTPKNSKVRMIVLGYYGKLVDFETLSGRHRHAIDHANESIRLSQASGKMSSERPAFPWYTWQMQRRMALAHERVAYLRRDKPAETLAPYWRDARKAYKQAIKTIQVVRDANGYPGIGHEKKFKEMQARVKQLDKLLGQAP